MRAMPWLAIWALGAAMAAGATIPIPGDARRGADLFETQKCITCHSVQGKGGRTAPDLGKRTGRAYTPSLMASLMWNHGPRMWEAMEGAGIPIPVLSPQQAADLYAYLYAFRYFERPGDAGRGLGVFTEKGCSGCHSLKPGGSGPGPAVTTWPSLADGIALAAAMWNHAPQMRTALASQKKAWPRLSSQELTDLVVYLRNLPERQSGPPLFSPAEPEGGAELFKAKGCEGCHRGSLALQGRLRSRTMDDFAAAMWNHASQMLQLPPGLSPLEMRRLVAYLWSVQYFEDAGEASRGESVYRKKGCASCHEGSSPEGPKLADRAPVNPIGMVSVLWKHGPGMLNRMQAKGLKWPSFRDREMSDLLAYLRQKK
jgi:cytochrome c2